MSQKTVLITREHLVDSIDILREAAPWAEFLIPDDREHAVELMPQADIVYGSFTEEMLEKSEDLEWVQVVSAGVDYLPQSRMNQHGITLTNMRGLHADTVSDHVMALTLAWARNIPVRVKNQQRRVWDREGGSRELAGMTIGIVGLGEIGKGIARRAKGFRMHVIGVQRDPDEQVEFVDDLVASDDLDRVLKQSEVLAIACPLTSDTEGMISDKQLAALPEGAFVVNIGRGKIIDEESLIESLRSGHLGGAGLDVFSEEPLPEDSPLWDMSNVIVTPHVGGQQTNYGGKAAHRFAHNLKLYHEGKPLKWVVDYKLEY